MMGSFFRLDSVDSDSSGASVSEEQFKSLSAMAVTHDYVTVIMTIDPGEVQVHH
jgi:hypothetical protein